MEDDSGGGGGGSDGSNTGEPGGPGDSILSFKDETKKVLEMFLRRSLSAPEETAVGRVGGCYHSDYDHRHQRCHRRRQGNGSVVKRVQDTVDGERKDEFYEKVARQLERLANQHQLRTAQSHDVDSWVSPDGVPRPLPGTPIEGWRITPEPGPPPGEPLARTRVERVAKPTPSPERTLSRVSAKDDSRVPRKDHKVPAGTKSGSTPSSTHRDCVEVDPDWMETHERINNAEEKKHGFKTRIKKLIRWESLKHGKKKKKKKEEEEEESAAMMVAQGWSDRDEEMLRGQAHRRGAPLGEAEDEAEEEERRKSPPWPGTLQQSLSGNGTGTVGRSGKSKWRGIGFLSLRRKSKAVIPSGEPAPTSPRPSTLPLKNIFRPSKKKGHSAVQEAVDIEKPEIDDKVTRKLERLANELSTAHACHLESDGVPRRPPGTPVEERRSTLEPGPQLPGPVQSVEGPRPSPGRMLWRALAMDGGKEPKTDHKAAAGSAAAAAVAAAAAAAAAAVAAANKTELQNETELIAELVTLLGLSGDALEKQIQQDVDLRSISYIFFCKFINAYITAETQDTTPSPEVCRPVHVRAAAAAAAAATPNKSPATDVVDSSVVAPVVAPEVAPVVARQPTPGSDASVRPPEVLQIALAMDLTKRMAGINQRAVTRIMGFGAQYLEERFSPWIMKQGGWHNILDPDSVSEYEVD